MLSLDAGGLVSWGYLDLAVDRGRSSGGGQHSCTQGVLYYLAGVFIEPLYMLQVVDGYLFTFYEQGGGDVVIIQTPGGVYITGDLISEDMDESTFALLKQNSAKS